MDKEDVKAGVDTTPAPQNTAQPRGAVTAAIVLTLAAWAVLMLSGIWAAVSAGAALLIVLLVMKRTHGAWRNTALATAVASGVLLAVLATFWALILVYLA